MRNLTRESIHQLLDGSPAGPTVTIYLPTHRAATPPNMTEDQIRLKNLIHKAVLSLKKRDDGRELATMLSDQLAALLTDRDFWEDQTEGLLICARPGQLTMFHLPIDTEEYVAVADHFHLAPVFGLLHDMHPYYVLHVAQQAPKLLAGDMFGLRETKLQLPVSVAAALSLDETNQKSEQQRSSGGDTGGFNGRGGAKDPREDDRQRFWRLLDRQLMDFADPKLPLILAGVETDLAEYRVLSNYPKILDEQIAGNVADLSEPKLFAAAFKILRRAVLNPDHAAAIAEYKRAKGQAPGSAAHEMAAIRQAADDGRVDKLLVADIRYTTDTVRDNQTPVPVLTFPPEATAQTTQDLAYEVWNMSGTILNIEQTHMPEPGAMVLATLRY